MLSATHSHSTPETIGLTTFREVPGVLEWLEGHLDDLVSTVVEAWESRQASRAFAGGVEVKDVARHRRIPLKSGELNRRGDLPADSEVAVPWEVDEELSVIYVETEAGSPQAVLLNYTAHPVIAMLLPPVSADYPGAATAFVEEALEGAVCLYTNGAAGDVNSVHVTTDFRDVKTVGERLGRAALSEVRRLKSGPPMESTSISVVRRCGGYGAQALPHAERDRSR